jgi:hypothetical protein
VLKNRRYWLAGFIACFSCMSHLLKNKLGISLSSPHYAMGCSSTSPPSPPSPISSFFNLRPFPHQYRTLVYWQGRRGFGASPDAQLRSMFFSDSNDCSWRPSKRRTASKHLGPTLPSFPSYPPHPVLFLTRPSLTQRTAKIPPESPANQSARPARRQRRFGISVAT